MSFRRKRTGNKRKRKSKGQRAFERADSRVIEGGHIGHNEILPLEKVINDTDLLQRPMPDERSVGYVPWEKMSKTQRERILKKQEHIVKSRIDSLTKYEAKRDIFSWERRLISSSFAHDKEAHRLLETEPESVCFWWWEKRNSLISITSDNTLVLNHGYLKEIGMDGRAYSVIQSQTSWSRFKATCTSFCVKGKVKTVFQNIPWSAIETNITRNFGSTKQGMRLDSTSGLFFVAYSLDKGGRYFGTLVFKVHPPSTSNESRSEKELLEEMSRSVVGVKEVLMGVGGVFFPVVCNCIYKEYMSELG